MSSTVDPSKEREWIAGVRAGDLDAFRTVFEAFGPRLRQFARVWVPNDIAEDLVQEVLFSVWQRRQDLDPNKGTLSGYLFSAVRNHVHSYLRRQHVARRVENEDNAYEFLGEDATLGPDVEVIRGDLEAAIRTGLASLPDGQRAVLMLRWTQGLSFAEIADILSISQNAAMILASRGRKALQPFVAPYIDG